MSEHTAAVTEQGHDAHGHDDHDSPEAIRKEVKVYLNVLYSLLVLTGVTVGLCFWLKLPVHIAILVAMAVAVVKGTLVAGYFMHLFSEKKLIYGVLLLTIFFFAVLLWGPWNHHYDTFGH